MKTSKYIENSDEELDKEYKPSKRSQSDDEEEFEEDAKEVKKPKTEEKQEKQQEKKAVARDATGNQIFELSHKRRITVRTFPSGEAAVDIREVYKDKASGEMKPGKTGILLPMAQWKKLKELMPDIDDAIKDLEK